MQGDNIFDMKVKNLIDFHKEKGACLTIVLREVDNVEGLGIADIDKMRPHHNASSKNL